MDSNFSKAARGAKSARKGKPGLDLFELDFLMNSRAREGLAARVGVEGVDWRAGGMIERGETGLEEGEREGALEKRGRLARIQTWMGVGNWPVRVR